MYNYIKELREEGREIGIEQGKKIAIYEAHQRGGDIELLSRLFALSEKKILQIIEEMKKREQAQ